MSETFAQTVKQIKENVITHGVYTSHIKFTVLDTKYGNVTFTTENLNYGNNLCCITSFENNKNGSGQANTFSITIAFSPSSRYSMFYSPMSGSLDYSDVNLIDKILNLNRGEKTSKQRKCKIQYGYSYPKNIMSPVYEGAIVDYSVEIQNGILNYTITGYSGLAIEAKDIRMSIQGVEVASPGDENFIGPLMPDEESEDQEPEDDPTPVDPDNPDEDTEGTEELQLMTVSDKIKPTELVQKIFDKYFSNSEYVLEWADDTLGTDKEIEIETAQDVTAISYMKSLLDTAEYENDDEDTLPERKSVYCMTISDKIHLDGKKRILIERYDPNRKQIESSGKDVIRFSWMGSGSGDGLNYAANAMVINFRSEFKGSVSMAYDYSALSDKYLRRSGIDSAGELVKVGGTTIPTTGSNSKNDNYVNLNLWANRLQYAYKATLIVVGIPYEIKILDNIYVAPMILGQEHHTGGLYKIIKITDVIDGSGFTTTLELIRNMAPGIKEQISEKKQEIKDFGIAHSQIEGEQLSELYNDLYRLQGAEENGVD